MSNGKGILNYKNMNDNIGNPGFLPIKRSNKHVYVFFFAVTKFKCVCSIYTHKTIYCGDSYLYDRTIK